MIASILDGRCGHICSLTPERLTSDVTKNTKGSRRQLLKHARLHAVKNGIDPLLDLARSTLAENEADIRARLYVPVSS